MREKLSKLSADNTLVDIGIHDSDITTHARSFIVDAKIVEVTTIDSFKFDYQFFCRGGAMGCFNIDEVESICLFEEKPIILVIPKKD